MFVLWWNDDVWEPDQPGRREEIETAANCLSAHRNAERSYKRSQVQLLEDQLEKRVRLIMPEDGIAQLHMTTNDRIIEMLHKLDLETKRGIPISFVTGVTSPYRSMHDAGKRTRDEFL
ncbi:unnamed protein product, partial [Mesorhabditis spiculigera]